MEQFIPTFQQLSDWHKVPYQNTTGTRAKRIYVDPHSETEYFFKCSKELDDGTFRYPYEFWSEIASSKIGQYLGFNLLDYNIGYAPLEKQPVGCLSKTMLDNAEDTLTEGVEYLRGFEPKYNPIKDESQYTLNFILVALTYFELGGNEGKFIEMLVFDSLIGNSDRHQENWGFITKYRETISQLKEQISQNPSWRTRWKLRIEKLITESIQFSRKREIDKNKMSTRMTLMNQSLIKSDFSPIYDSGCSLGRELNEDRIRDLLDNPKAIANYISKGRAEIRFEVGKKPKHFELMKFLIRHYPIMFTEVRKRIKNKWNDADIKLIIDNLDRNLPPELKDHKLPDIRKELMYNLVALRKDYILTIK